MHDHLIYDRTDRKFVAVISAPTSTAAIDGCVVACHIDPMHDLDTRDWEAVVNLMDRDICDTLEADGIDDMIEYFRAYSARHAEKFGAEFEPAKHNPVW